VHHRCVRRGPRWRGIAVFTHFLDRLVREFDFRSFDFFEHGILLQLLLDEGFQFQRGRLQQRQRLLELRRKHHRLRQARGELQALNHLRGKVNQLAPKTRKIGMSLAS